MPGLGALTVGLRRRLPRGRFGRGVAMLAGGAAAGQGIVVLASPLLTRLYGPADFGLMAAYAAVLALALVGASWRYQLAIPLPEDDETAASLLVLSMAGVLCTAAAGAALVVACGPACAGWAGQPGLAPYLWLLPLGLLGGGAYQAIHHWSIRRGGYATIARTRVTQATGQLGVQLAFGLGGFGPLGLLLGDAVGRASGTTLLVREAWRADRRLFLGVTAADLAAVARRYRRFPLWTTPAAWLNALGRQLPALVLGAMFGPAFLGLYALGQRVFGVPMELLGDTIGKVFYGEGAREAIAGPGGLERLFWKTSLGLAALAAPLVAALALTGPWLCEVAFGPAWREAGVYLQLLAPMFFAKLVASPPPVLVMLERHDLGLFREVVRLGMVATTLGLAWWYGLGPMETVFVLGASEAASYAFYFAVSWFALQQHRPAEGPAVREEVG